MSCRIAQRLKRPEQDGESERAKEPIGGSSKQRRLLLLVAHLVLMQFDKPGAWGCVGCFKIMNKRISLGYSKYCFEYNKEDEIRLVERRNLH